MKKHPKASYRLVLVVASLNKEKDGRTHTHTDWTLCFIQTALEEAEPQCFTPSSEVKVVHNPSLLCVPYESLSWAFIQHNAF